MEWVDFVFEVVKGLCEDPRLIVERDGNRIGISMMLTRPDHPKPWKSVALDVWAFEENKPSFRSILAAYAGNGIPFSYGERRLENLR